MKASRVVAVLIVLGSAGWIASGTLGQGAQKAATAPREAAPAARFTVAVAPVQVEPHARRIVLSGRTEADKRATAVTRASGVIVDLRVKRGSVVRKGDVIAMLSDEARESMVTQARARFEQRQTELKARLRSDRAGQPSGVAKAAA